MTFSSLAPPPASFSAHARPPSTTSAYSGIWAAAVMSDGFVVASRGLNSLIELMSPVSATVTVILVNCSSKLDMVAYSPLRHAARVGNPDAVECAGRAGQIVAGLGGAGRPAFRDTRDGEEQLMRLKGIAVAGA